jgi:hypothetical protein
MLTVIHLLHGNLKKWLMLALILAVSGGCIGPRYWDGYVGKVVDADTGEPLENVFVIARYSGDIPAGGSFQTVCYHAAGTTTNAQGEYRMNPRFDTPDFYFDKRSDIDFFKARYESVYYKDGVGKLKKDTGNREKRLEELTRIVRTSGCGGAGKSLRALYPFYKAIYYEAKSISVTQDELKQLRWFQERAADKAIASNFNVPASEAEAARQKFMEENLK